MGSDLCTISGDIHQSNYLINNVLQVECLDVSPDGTLFATGGRDNKIVLSTIHIDETELQKWSVQESHTNVTRQQSTDGQGMQMSKRLSRGNNFCCVCLC